MVPPLTMITLIVSKTVTKVAIMLALFLVPLIPYFALFHPSSLGRIIYWHH